MLGVEAFQAWIEVNAACFNEESEDLASHLELLYRQFYDRGRQLRSKAKGYYDRKVNSVGSRDGARVLLWSMELSKVEGKRPVIPELDEKRCCVSSVESVTY